MRRALTFDRPARVPRQLFWLPWAEIHYPEVLKEINVRFPSDITGTPYRYNPSPLVKGDPHAVGLYTDEWGCTFSNIQAGVIGEVKEPLLPDLRDWKRMRPPYEQLPTNPGRMRNVVNRFCGETDIFVMADICPRPWERYQFIRGTENALMDVMILEEGFRSLLRSIHEFYLKEMELWVQTDVDAVMFMDDWGGQDRLLISPDIWREFFKPLYSDYCDLAHAHGKFAFMHSDGWITAIYPDLIEVGVDALNSQLFCMDIPELARIAKGKITFWGEIDRQFILTASDPEEGRKAVRYVAEHLYDPAGGVIAQFEFTPGACPDTALVIFDEWAKVDGIFRI
ncbi:MAG: methyltransferase [Candidatus Aminicenantes bacterium]|nr:methyltransferase [Candidatus Aminicenantes bacterium]